MKAKSKITKIVSVLLIISILTPTVLFSRPKKAEAIPVAEVPGAIVHLLSEGFNKLTSASTTTSASIDVWGKLQKIGAELLKVAAKRLLAKMTQATVNWINSGFHGSPLFLTNPDSFFRDIAKTQVKSIVDMIGYDSFRFPFGKQTALNVIDSYRSQLATNSQYTLSKVINDPDLLVQYRNDFNYGGWNGFLINTQYPQNNYLGFNMLIQQSLASQLQGTIQAPAQKVQNALQQGMGFLSPQTCPSNPAYNNGINEFTRPDFVNPVKFPKNSEIYKGIDLNAPDAEAKYNAAYAAAEAKYYADSAAAEAEWSKKNTCPGGLVSTTPGSVAANATFNALNTPSLSTALDGAIGNSLSAIFDALLNHFLDKGLTGLSGSVSSNNSTDNWSYNGVSLTGGTGGTVIPTGTSGTTPLNIPTNVSVTVGETTSTGISGGNGDYVIQGIPDPEIASAGISFSGSSGPIITVTGKKKGRTAVVVNDTSRPTPESVTIYITVNEIGELVTIPASTFENPIKINVNETSTIAISGGEEEYKIQTGPNESVALATLAGTNLLVSGLAPGKTFMVIKDSSVPVKTVRVEIETVGPQDLGIPSDITVDQNQEKNITISGGTAPYKISDQSRLDESVATAEISNNILKITGVASGNTSIVIEDSSFPPKVAGMNIAISDPNNPLGTCIINGTINTGVTQTDCNSASGRWSSTATNTGGSGTLP